MLFTSIGATKKTVTFLIKNRPNYYFDASDSKPHGRQAVTGTHLDWVSP